MNKKGYIYTVVTLMLGLILLAVVSLYFESIKNASEIEPGKVRTDELHYFVESVKTDLERAMGISGHRGAIYLVGYVINRNSTESDYLGKPLKNATVSLAETIVNASVTEEDGTKVELIYMENHTIKMWFDKTKRVGDKIYFDTNLSVGAIDIYPFDAFSFLQIVSLDVNISDRGGSKSEMCFYKKKGLKYYSIISFKAFEGVEDPFYPLHTKHKIQRKFGEGNSSSLVELIATGTHGSGMGGGVVVDLSQNDSGDLDTEICKHNITNDPNAFMLPYKIFLINASYNPNPAAITVLESSGGLLNRVDYDHGSPNYAYVSGIGQINLSSKDHLVLLNNGTSQILYLGIVDDVKNESYYRSTEGPSFFDRLEGTDNLSEKYLNRSVIAREKMGAEPDGRIGLESFVNVSEMNYFELYGKKDESGTWCCQIIPDFTNQSSVDYEYFNNTFGRWLYGTPWWFRLDGQHINEYNLTDYVYDLGALASYHFEESDVTDIAYSSTKINRTGRLFGVDRIQGEGSNSALSFNGSGEWVQLTPSLNEKPEWTISVWVNASDDGYIYSEAAPGLTTFSIRITPTGAIEAGAMNGTWKAGTSDPGLVEFDEWNHIAVTLRNGTADFYINGAYNSSDDLWLENNSGTSLAALGNNIGAPSYYEGSMDEFKIWGRALSATEIKDEYDSLNP